MIIIKADMCSLSIPSLPQDKKHKKEKDAKKDKEESRDRSREEHKAKSKEAGKEKEEKKIRSRAILSDTEDDEEEQVKKVGNYFEDHYEIISSSIYASSYRYICLVLRFLCTCHRYIVKVAFRICSW